MRFKNILLGSVLTLAMASGVATSVSAAGDELPETKRYVHPEGIWKTVIKPYFDSRGIVQHETCTKYYSRITGVNLTCTNTEMRGVLYNKPHHISESLEFPIYDTHLYKNQN